MAQARLLGNRYRLDSVVGQGGMGTVWRAFDVMLDREVAVKEVVFPPGLTEDERAILYERTFREARASARLNHPGVVTVHDVVQEGDRPWIVMELVSAPSLQDVIERGTLDPRRVADIGLQMLGALRHAHEKGILHRDIKPSNVLVTDSGRVVLTDFGIAQMEGDATLTQTGLVMGSPAYIPPERAQGERAVPASDLWALGATLYAAVEGRSPYERSDAMSSLQAVLTEPVPVARHAGPLARVLDGLLAREPVHRMTAAQAQPLLTRVAAMPAPSRPAPSRPARPPAPPQPRPQPQPPSETVMDEPSTRRRPAARVEDAAETVLDPAGFNEPVTRLDPPEPDPVTRRDPGPGPAGAGERNAQTLLQTEWAPPPSRPNAPSRSNDPPQTPPPWEQPQQYSNWQQPQPPARPAAAPGGERHRTVLVVTVAVILVVAAVLLGAFILRGKLRSNAQAEPMPRPVSCAPFAVTDGCSDTTSVITM
ncbi:serine/threonine protein kinase [Actinomadura sp. NAK00032]|uniref:serine/threonine-protein kinase n=1 Tax=Actinomadura sp. NAK00032 TaxID=2742128 RepID=UPI001590DA95|nr:serine/threonine-protein kinase [Actinomadura sp. NAK00032]QKW38882.1 serine/threonine protein kinase [Actinomadura sp. NAK00032]